MGVDPLLVYLVGVIMTTVFAAAYAGYADEDPVKTVGFGMAIGSMVPFLLLLLLFSIGVMLPVLIVGLLLSIPLCIAYGVGVIVRLHGGGG